MNKILAQEPRSRTLTPDFSSKYGVEPLSDKACNVLRHAILSGRFPPGTQLKEITICEMFGLSRTPVRHAFAKLTAEGLVEQMRNVGTFVRKLTLHEEIEIMETRRVLESAVAALAAEKASKEEKALLIELAKESEAQRESGTNEGLLDAELLFHREMIRISGNRDIIRLTGNLHAIFMTFTLDGKADRAPNEVSHIDVAEAVAHGDPNQAFTAMWRHLAKTLQEWREKVLIQSHNDERQQSVS